MNIKRYDFKAWSIWCVCGRFKVILDEEYVCMINPNWHDLGV